MNPQPLIAALRPQPPRFRRTLPIGGGQKTKNLATFGRRGQERGSGCQTWRTEPAVRPMRAALPRVVNAAARATGDWGVGRYGSRKPSPVPSLGGRGSGLDEVRDAIHVDLKRSAGDVDCGF